MVVRSFFFFFLTLLEKPKPFLFLPSDESVLSLSDGGSSHAINSGRR